MAAQSLPTRMFLILYSSSYTILLLILFIFLAVTPGDHIYQTVSNKKYGNVFVVGGVCLVTALIALFIYSSRLYTNRTTLTAIPKPYIPIEEGEVSSSVRRLIAKNRQRSALIAWESRPKDLGPHEKVPGDSDDEKQKHSRTRRRLKAKAKVPKKRNGEVLAISSTAPPWGEVTHPGWSSPATRDLADVHFDTVISELPHLIEAKAVSLAPTAPPARGFSQHELPNPEIVQLLQRPKHMGLRAYLARLNGLGTIRPPTLAGAFLAHYECARFSTFALSEGEFRELMDTFSELIVGMGQGDWLAFRGAHEDVDMQGQSKEAPRSDNSPSEASSVFIRRGGEGSAGLQDCSESTAESERSSNASVVRDSVPDAYYEPS